MDKVLHRQWVDQFVYSDCWVGHLNLDKEVEMEEAYLPTEIAYWVAPAPKDRRVIMGKGAWVSPSWETLRKQYGTKDWFAWYPVRVLDGTWAWLETVEFQEYAERAVGSGRYRPQLRRVYWRKGK